jgi:hypothetical protein
LLAHGFGIRYDLPVPLYLYLIAAAAAVVITFAILGAYVRRAQLEGGYPRLSLTRWRTLAAIVCGPAPRAVGGAIGFIVLAAVVITGLAGSTDATSNPAEFLVWIYFWAGLVVISGLLGNLYALVNPWSAIYDAVQRLRRREPGKGVISYPARLGIWPAVAGYFVFAWFELASGQSAHPRVLAAAALVYTLYTLAMMWLVGRDRWLARGEVFSVLFRYVGAFGPVEVRADDAAACSQCTSHCTAKQTSCVNCFQCFRRAQPRDVALRPWAVGLLALPEFGWDVVTFIILTLSSLAFDGISATPAWASVIDATGSLSDALGPAGPVLVKTLGLIAVTALFLTVFIVVVRLIAWLGGAPDGGVKVSTLFAVTLVPIALVYNAAHNYSYMVIQGQGLFPLLADPLHSGAHLLPTSGYVVSFALADARLVWYVQVVLIVIGHMLSVYLAHARALAMGGTRASVIRGQLPMVALMVAYTMTSLWILSQPITESG